MKKYFNKIKPKNKEVIGIKAIDDKIPEIGIYEVFENGIEEVYLPAYDEALSLDKIEYWFELPK